VSAFDVGRGRWGRVIEVTGTAENLDIACWVYEWVLETAARMWAAYRRENPEVHGIDRRTYIAGVVSGFGDTLRAGVREAEAVGLVWVGDPGLRAHFSRRFPRVTSTPLSVRRSSAFSDGQDAGRRLVLRKPVTGTEDRGRMLGGPSDRS
jgi:hypothetical protein